MDAVRIASTATHLVREDLDDVVLVREVGQVSSHDVPGFPPERRQSPSLQLVAEKRQSQWNIVASLRYDDGCSPGCNHRRLVKCPSFFCPVSSREDSK